MDCPRCQELEGLLKECQMELKLLKEFLEIIEEWQVSRVGLNLIIKLVRALKRFERMKDKE